MYVFRLASLEPLSKEIFAVKPERRFQRMYVRHLNTDLMLFSALFYRVALWEFSARFTHPLCSYLPHSTSPTPICSVVTIVDFDNVSFKSLWNLRGHLQEASALATANYPETLHTTAIVNAPSFFPIVWGWIKVERDFPRSSHYKQLTVFPLDRTGLMRGRRAKSECWDETLAPSYASLSTTRTSREIMGESWTLSLGMNPI